MVLRNSPVGHVHRLPEDREDPGGPGIPCHPADLHQLSVRRETLRKADYKRREHQMTYFWSRNPDASFPLNSWKADWATFTLSSQTEHVTPVYIGLDHFFLV